MSTFYRVSLNVCRFREDRLDAIVDVIADKLFAFDRDAVPRHVKDASLNHRESIFVTADTEIIGEGEEYVEQMSKAIWKANGAFCPIQIQLTCLTDLPFNDYLLSEWDYKRLVAY